MLDKKRCRLLFFLLSAIAYFSSANAQNDTIKLNDIDGPYIIHKGESLEIVRVTKDGLSIETRTNKGEPFRVSSQDEKHQFEVTLHNVERPAWKYNQPDKTLIMSDPHANMDAFVSVLLAQGVINDSYEWTWDDGHLVIIGDVFDRGDDVLPIFWLIYKLEEEASKAGGAVHFLLGNHEEMILRNNLKYTNAKYKNLAEKLGVQYRELWNRHTELGYWLITRNTIEVIGSNLIVHAGLSKDFFEQQWKIPQLNEVVSSFLYLIKEERSKSEEAKFLFGSGGPFWYRGMVRTDEKYNPVSDEYVNKILDAYNVKRIYVGHTIFDEVSLFYEGKVIGVNVNNKRNKDAGKSRGVLIENEKCFLIDDEPGKRLEISKF